MKTKNPFEKHWKFLRSLTSETWTHFEDIDSFETNFKKELEKQAKKAEKEANRNYKLENKHKKHKQYADFFHECWASAKGFSLALRLVKGKSEKK